MKVTNEKTGLLICILTLLRCRVPAENGRLKGRSFFEMEFLHYKHDQI